MSKEIPMLFSTPMVQAILNKLKNQTRRTKGLDKINENPNNWEFVGLGPNPENEKDDALHAYFKIVGTDTWMHIKCPYGIIGDILWVRETWINGPNYPEFGERYRYKASESKQFISEWKWKPSIFMPKAACRIKLQVEKINVERLNDISKIDAISEGIEYKEMLAVDGFFFMFKNYLARKRDLLHWNRNPIDSYESLWDKINDKGSWDKNPWVWVIKFRILEIKK
jgi:hypothetical protein